MNTATAVLDRLSTLGEHTRCRLLAVLEHDEFTVSELCQVVQLPQPTVSRHLKVLADQGWVRARAEGTSRLYRRVEALSDDAQALWAVVASQLHHTPVARDDRERAAAVTARREDRAAAYFSASASRWDEVRSSLYGERADLLPLFGLLDPGWTVVDLGTGTGLFAATVAPFVARVIGVDRSPEMLESAARRTAHLDNVELLEADLEALDLPEGSVDLAVASLVLHYLPDPGCVLARVAKALRPGGRVVVVDMRPHQRPEYADTMGHRWAGFDPARLGSWLRDAGLEPGPQLPMPADPDADGPLLFVRTAVRPSSLSST